MICKLQVVSYTYSRTSFARAFLRNFGKTISSSIFFAGYWLVLLNRKNQGFHDYLASTYVIKPRPQALDPLGMTAEDGFV